MRRLLVIVPLFAIFYGCTSQGSEQEILSKADSLVAEGKFDEAILNYKKVLQKNEGSAAAFRGIGRAFNAQNKRLDAFAAFTRALQLKPADLATRIDLAEFCVEELLASPSSKRCYDTVVKLSKEMLQADPKSAAGNKYVGYIAMIENRPADAASAYEAAWSADPKNPETARLAVQSHFQASNAPSAEALLERALRTHASYGPLWDTAYFELRRLGRVEDAEKLLLRKIAQNPKQEMFVTQLARHHRNRGRFDQSLSTLESLKQPSAFPHGFQAGGDYFMQLGEIVQALSWYEQGVTANPTDAQSLKKSMVPALLALGRLNDAAAILDELYKADPGALDIRASRAALMLASKDPKDHQTSLNEYSSLVELKPGEARYRYDLARALSRVGRVNDARTQLLLVTQKDPLFVPALRDLAVIAIDRRNFQEASNYIGRALSLSPGSPEIELLQTAVWVVQGRSAEARRVITRLVSQYPSIPEARMQMAMLDATEKRFREAETTFRSMLGPKNSDIRVVRGLIDTLLLQNKNSEAIKFIQTELSARPENVELRQLLAGTAARIQDFPVAVEQYRWLVEKMPKTPEYRVGLALVHQELGEYPEAIRLLKTTLDEDPKDPSLHAAIAYAYQQAGQLQPAIAAYRQALHLKPDDLLAMNNLSVALSESGSNLDEALRLAETALNREPQNPYFLASVGLAQEKRKQFDISLTHVRRAISILPTQPEFQIQLARVLISQGDKTSARTALLQARRLRPGARQEAELTSLEQQVR